MTREVWREFICSPDRASRHLSFIGQGVGGAVSDALDLSVLEDFLRKLSGGEDDIVLLSDTVDLLTGGYDAFMLQTLPNLLDAMSSESVSQQEIVGPGIRGNPLWGQTIVGRLSGRLPCTHAVSRTSHRSYDLPENRLLTWLVSDIEKAIGRILGRVGTKALHPKLVAMLTACRTAASHPVLSTLTEEESPFRISEAAASRHRRPAYREAASLARRRADTRRDNDDTWWNNVLSLLAVGWLEPIDDDRLFELYVLVLVMAVLSEECAFGEPVEFGLVTAGRRHVAAFDRRGATVRLYFNQTPATVLGVETRYSTIIRAYSGITGAPRRPDLLIVVERDGSKRLIIVEVKETSDRDYISSSVYKLFAYLHDFEVMFSGQTGVKAILLVPEGIARTSSVDVGHLRIASAHRRADVAAAIVDALA